MRVRGGTTSQAWYSLCESGGSGAERKKERKKAAAVFAREEGGRDRGLMRDFEKNVRFCKKLRQLFWTRRSRCWSGGITETDVRAVAAAGGQCRRGHISGAEQYFAIGTYAVCLRKVRCHVFAEGVRCVVCLRKQKMQAAL